jgi:hypothetical protein
VELCQVQGAEVLIVALVDKDLVYVKEEAIWDVLWWVIVAIPIESI